MSNIVVEINDSHIKRQETLISSPNVVHHENEELHLQVEKLQKENSQIKAKLAIMSDDNEKLGGLKVMSSANFYYLSSQWQIAH